MVSFSFFLIRVAFIVLFERVLETVRFIPSQLRHVCTFVVLRVLRQIWNNAFEQLCL
jgi:hypothetical protein